MSKFIFVHPFVPHGTHGNEGTFFEKDLTPSEEETIYSILGINPKEEMVMVYDGTTPIYHPKSRCEWDEENEELVWKERDEKLRNLQSWFV